MRKMLVRASRRSIARPDRMARRTSASLWWQRRKPRRRGLPYTPSRPGSRSQDCATGEPVHLVDHDHVDQMGLNIGQQPLESRPFRRSAGISAVVIKAGKGGPALVPLTLYIGVTGLALRMQGIEILFQSLFGGFPGVDGAAKYLGPGWNRVTHFARPSQILLLKLALR